MRQFLGTMCKTAAVTGVVALIAGCTTGPLTTFFPGETQDVPVGVSYLGGDGVSVERAVVIVGASPDNLARAQRTWLNMNYPKHVVRQQSLVRYGERYYDVVEIRTGEGQRGLIYFDVTDYVDLSTIEALGQEEDAAAEETEPAG